MNDFYIFTKGLYWGTSAIAAGNGLLEEKDIVENRVQERKKLRQQAGGSLEKLKKMHVKEICEMVGE